MVDVDKLSDAELRTKLLEFGFPVMPITGTTRKVMVKKLKLLLENKNKAASGDGRRSLGRYSSEEESDTDAKSARKERNRRVTMAAPVSSTTTRVTRKVSVEPPEVVSSSPKKREVRSTTSTTTTTRSSRILKNAQDDFDTGSDSESDIVASSNKYDTGKHNDSRKYNDSFNDVEFNKKSSGVLGSLSSSYSRYSPPKSEEVNYSTIRNLSYGANVSPSRQTLGESAGLGGSLASDYAADRLNQIRSRLSLGSSGYDRSSTYASTSSANADANLEEKDTPFLSNFTKRLSALSATKKPDYDSRSDLVKEHDTNGSSLYGKSYLANFRATKGREPIYEYKNREGSGKNNLVSFAVLAGAALFFVFLAVVYLGMRSDTSIISSGKNNPYSKV